MAIFMWRFNLWRLKVVNIIQSKFQKSHSFQETRKETAFFRKSSQSVSQSVSWLVDLTCGVMYPKLAGITNYLNLGEGFRQDTHSA